MDRDVSAWHMDVGRIGYPSPVGLDEEACFPFMKHGRHVKGVEYYFLFK